MLWNLTKYELYTSSIYFNDRKFRGQKVSRLSRFFLAFFAKVSAKAQSKFKIRESICSRNYRKFSTSKRFFHPIFLVSSSFALLSLITPIFSKRCKLSPRLWVALKMNRNCVFPSLFFSSESFFTRKCIFFLHCEVFVAKFAGKNIIRDSLCP